MNSEGFYRVVLDGQHGVGCCRHYDSVAREETYETWTILILSPGDRELYPCTTTINSTRPDFLRLKVGKPIRGLPTNFQIAC